MCGPACHAVYCGVWWFGNDETGMRKYNKMIIDQYDCLKANYPSSVLLLRIGDYYNSFRSDALIVSEQLSIELIEHNDIDLVSFSRYTLNHCLDSLLKSGYSVCVCEQF